MILFICDYCYGSRQAKGEQATLITLKDGKQRCICFNCQTQYSMYNKVINNCYQKMLKDNKNEERQGE